MFQRGYSGKYVDKAAVIWWRASSITQLISFLILGWMEERFEARLIVWDGMKPWFISFEGKPVTWMVFKGLTFEIDISSWTWETILIMRALESRTLWWFLVPDPVVEFVRMVVENLERRWLSWKSCLNNASSVRM